MPTPFKRADPTVEGFMMRLGGWRSTAASLLRTAIHKAAPDVRESVRGSSEARFVLNEPLCIIKAYPTHLNLIFYRGADLDDPDGLLRDYGKARLSYLHFGHLEEVDVEVVTRFLEEAIALAKSKKKKKKKKG
jgi:hypothetical protein